ncbi:MAG TPA: hypothetical protein VF796_06750 [Humisphaera sp.]
MLNAYRATINGDRIEWDGGERPELTAGARVIVTVLDVPPTGQTALPPSDGEAMMAALEEIAARGGPKGFGDPVEWQREVRRDRPLPGRDDE